jgi:hypothetical protein
VIYDDKTEQGRVDGDSMLVAVANVTIQGHDNELFDQEKDKQESDGPVFGKNRFFKR